jgi:hypothetical protein
MARGKDMSHCFGQVGKGRIIPGAVRAKATYVVAGSFLLDETFGRGGPRREQLGHKVAQLVRLDRFS